MNVLNSLSHIQSTCTVLASPSYEALLQVRHPPPPVFKSIRPSPSGCRPHGGSGVPLCLAAGMCVYKCVCECNCGRNGA
jgi:hypothetical protein